MDSDAVMSSPGQPTMVDSNRGVLDEDTLAELRKEFFSEPKNILAMNVCSKHDPLDVCTSRHVVETTQHVFTHRVDAEVKPVTNQKNSGRCWIFATLNLLRIPFVKQHQLEDFEFSQGYLFYWEKIERSNFFLRTVVDVLRRGESVSGRLMSFLLHDPLSDGGQWDMIVNIISKYGVMPKKCFPETFCCETSCRLNAILKSKVREYTRNLDILVKRNTSDEIIEEVISGYLKELYRIIGICLAVPPEKFQWQYYNKNKAHFATGPITPVAFYEEYVRPYFDIGNKICIVNDPRKENPYRQTYTVDCLGNMVGGRKTLYLNLEIEEMIKYAVESIKNNEPVWFGCDVGKKFAGKLGIQDLHVHDYRLVFGTDVATSITKEERLKYGDSAMNHAMVFTAVHLTNDGVPTKWRVENTWGDDRGEKGYLLMTTDWFKEFVFEVVVNKQYVPKDVLELLDKEPTVLPAWDPMGSLASSLKCY